MSTAARDGAIESPTAAVSRTGALGLAQSWAAVSSRLA